jgi:hypothetical protein
VTAFLHTCFMREVDFSLLCDDSILRISLGVVTGLQWSKLNLVLKYTLNL